MIYALTLCSFTLFSVEKEVTYSLVAGEKGKMDIYLPMQNSKEPTAAVLVIHGGAWISGKREDMAEIATALAKEGFVAATTSYRLAPKDKWPAQFDDVQTAIRFLRANSAKWNIDSKRIGAAGASAGGHLALLLGSRETRDPKPTEYPGVSSKATVVFNIFGPTLLNQDFDKSVDFLIQTVLGKPRSQAEKEILEASPLHYIDSQTAPVFTLHGTEDKLVPVNQAKRLDEKLKEVKVPHETVIIKGMGHAVDKNQPEVLQAMIRGIDFLKKHLKTEQSDAKKCCFSKHSTIIELHPLQNCLSFPPQCNSQL